MSNTTERLTYVIVQTNVWRKGGGVRVGNKGVGKEKYMEAGRLRFRGKLSEITHLVQEHQKELFY